MTTIAEVARAAGVSPSTVSYVLTGKRPISSETSARVRRAIAELGYQPHAGARALAGARTNILALVVPLRVDENIPVVMQIVAAVVTRARTHGQDVLLLTKEEGVEELRRVAATSLVDGLIITDVEADDPRVPVVRSLDQPAVLIGVPERSAGVSCVDLDFTGAGALAVDELADLGHHAVGLLGPPARVYERGTGFARKLLQGMEQAAARRGVHLEHVGCEPTASSVREGLADLYTRHPGLTGLVVHNEGTLPHLAGALRARGLTSPDDVSVVCVCPDDLAEQAGVAWTNIHVPTQELGELSVEMLMGLLDGNDLSQIRLLAPVLTRRATLAQAPDSAS